jgi:antirestriction protein ArdC
MINTPKAQEALKQLEEGVSEIQNSEQFQAYLQFASRFHEYSWGNIVLIMSQRPDATRVAGFKAWKKLGRHVRKGETGIRILAPMTTTWEDDEGNQRSKIIGFKLVSVFDISQTEGKPIPKAPVYELLESASDQGQVLRPILLNLMREQNITYGRGELANGVQGFWKPGKRQIVTDERLALDMEVKVITHELAHAFTEENLGGYQEFRPEHETVAEGAAFVTLANFGIDTGSASFTYIATWAQDPKVLSKHLQAIQSVSNRLIQMVNKHATVALGEYQTPQAA